MRCVPVKHRHGPNFRDFREIENGPQAMGVSLPAFTVLPDRAFRSPERKRISSPAAFSVVSSLPLSCKAQNIWCSWFAALPFCGRAKTTV